MLKSKLFYNGVWIKKNKSPGIVVGMIDDRGSHVIAYGKLKTDLLNSAEATSVDGNTIFEIGSITKVFTALALVQLAEQDQLRFKDPISKFLPDSVKAPSYEGQAISLQALASHSSSLPRLPDNLAPEDIQNPYADYSIEQLYDFLDRYQLTRKMGSSYEYSNLGAGLLGHLLSRQTGKDYETLISDQITQPLQMQDTRIQLTSSQQTRFATGHNQLGQSVAYWDLPTLAGAGALRSTVNDLLKFLAANLELQPSPVNASLQKTHVVQLKTDEQNLAIALGWHILNQKNQAIICHSGGTGGFRSFIGFIKDKRRGIVVLSNSENDIDDLGLHLLDRRIPLAQRKPPKTAIAVDSNILATYMGRYELNPNFILTITEQQGKLYVQATGQEKFELFAATETEFFLTVVEAEITFLKNSTDQVDRLILNQNGRKLPALKMR
ncbi:MAG: serine hydrolase [Synechococcales cyanobacterium RU_4_20]|nr:serine hydrolase [Synechococcales cyanobacterium RU_4_20]